MGRQFRGEGLCAGDIRLNYLNSFHEILRFDTAISDKKGAHRGRQSEQIKEKKKESIWNVRRREKSVKMVTIVSERVRYARARQLCVVYYGKQILAMCK